MGPVAAVGAICPVFASFGVTMVGKLKRGPYRSLVLAALLAGLCQAGQAQEAPGGAPSTTFTSGVVTLFQNVRIFDGKSAALSAPSNDEDASPLGDPVSRRKALEVFAGTDNAYKLAKKYKVKTAFGSDALFDARVASRQGAQLAKLVRWYTTEALKMATADNGEFMALSGFSNPYPGKLCVVEEGALADLLLVDGNPLENIKLIEDPDKNFPVIMKDGRIYKNALRK